jgi:hydroxymethylpyrimidine pyrophosphatase-like HAD family hydrolase
MVPKGYSKGTGILKVCEILGKDVRDTFAFGDSPNDIEMLKTAGISIVMGNGDPYVKTLADYVTTSVEKDGIWTACRHFEII